MLKPCPFCGENPIIETSKKITYIFCNNEDCPMDAVEVEDCNREEAIKAWNTRKD